MQGKTFTMELAGKTLTIETGKYCEQAGGSAFVRMGDAVRSPIIDEGGADVILAFEKLEALRYLHYLKEGGVVL